VGTGGVLRPGDPLRRQQARYQAHAHAGAGAQWNGRRPHPRVPLLLHLEEVVVTRDGSPPLRATGQGAARPRMSAAPRRPRRAPADAGGGAASRGRRAAGSTARRPWPGRTADAWAGISLPVNAGFAIRASAVPDDPRGTTTTGLSVPPPGTSASESPNAVRAAVCQVVVIPGFQSGQEGVQVDPDNPSLNTLGLGLRRPSALRAVRTRSSSGPASVTPSYSPSATTAGPGRR
jgi:hypothetical protein